MLKLFGHGVLRRNIYLPTGLHNQPVNTFAGDITKRRHTLRNMLQGHKAGIYCSIRFPCLTLRLYGRNFVSVTCCRRISWFEFVGYEAGTTSIFNIASFVLLLKTLTRYNTEINQCSCLRRVTKNMLQTNVPLSKPAAVCMASDDLLLCCLSDSAGTEWGYNKRKVTETTSLSRGYSSLGVDCKI